MAPKFYYVLANLLTRNSAHAKAKFVDGRN